MQDQPAPAQAQPIATGQQPTATAPLNLSAPNLPKVYHNLYRLLGPNTLGGIAVLVIAFVAIAPEQGGLPVALILGIPYLIALFLVTRQRVVATSAGLTIRNIFQTHTVPWTDIRGIEMGTSMWRVLLVRAVAKTDTRSYDITSALYGGWFYGTRLIGQINPWDKRNTAVMAELNALRSMHTTGAAPSTAGYSQQVAVATEQAVGQRDQLVQQTIATETHALHHSWIIRIGGALLFIVWVAILAAKGGPEIYIWLLGSLVVVVAHIIHGRTKSQFAQTLMYAAIAVLVVIMVINGSRL